VVDGAGGPPVRERVGRASPFESDRRVPAPVRAEELVALRVERRRPVRAGEVREVVAPLPVLGLVEDHALLDLDLPRREIALEVGRVVPRIPQAELDGGEERQARRLRSFVVNAGPPDLEGLAEWHEIEDLGRDRTRPRRDDRVAEPVPARVVVGVSPDRLPRRAPELARRVVAHVDVTPAGVGRDVVVAVPRQPAQPRVAIEGVAAAGVRDDAEVILAPEIVDPGQRGVGSCDDVFTTRVVEMAEVRRSPFRRLESPEDTRG
jgi:hypothetical protein